MANDGEVLFESAKSFYFGDEKPQDYSEAYRLFLLAANLGHIIAEFMLGVMYKEGEGVPRDAVESVKWYRLSANQGNADAQCCIGYAYRYGQGVEQDYEVAVKWYRLSAEQGDATVACVISFLMTGHRSVYPSQVLATKKSPSFEVETGKEIEGVNAQYQFRENSLIGLISNIIKTLNDKIKNILSGSSKK